MLKIFDLRKSYPTPQGPLMVLKGVNLTLEPATSLALMGESAPWYFGGSGHASTLTGTSEELSKLPLADANDSRHDALLALMEWVENEKPVEYLVATKWRNDSLTEEIVRQRPLCSWPKQAVYKGQGDVNKASNWRCR